MGAPGDMAGDLIEMELHGLRVGVGYGNSRTGSSCWTDGTEEIGILIALIGRLAGPRSASGPLADDAIFLTDAGLVLEPDFQRRCARQIGDVGPQRLREVLWNGPPLLPVM